MRLSLSHPIVLAMACMGATARTCAQAGTPAHEVLAPAAFMERLTNAPGTLIDVRTPEEWAQGVIEGALLLDFRDPGFGEAVLSTDRDRPVYLYCAVGGRSYKAAQLLLKNGYPHVVELDGGMDAWRGSGQMVVPPGSDSKR
jgi:rhodanese-related sulfurtransferase